MLTPELKESIIACNKLVDVEDEELEDEEPLIMKTKKNKLSRTKANVDSPIDLNEYWQVKNKNEYMNNEIERLNNKVNKLKHYKTIVNKLTGGEYDPVIPDSSSTISTTQVPATASKNNFSRSINDNLFMF